MTAAWLVRGDARRLPLADKSVQVCVTSPPYFGLRNYGNQTSVWSGDPKCEHEWMLGRTVEREMFQESSGPVAGRAAAHTTIHKASISSSTCTLCGAWRGELGSEPTTAMFVTHLVEVFAEVWRVLRPDGVAFLNMGSSMAGSGKGPTGKNGLGDQGKRQGFVNQTSQGIRPKSDMLIPFRLASALSDAGWVVRQVLIWSKPNPMPESVRDRWTTAHEYILMLVKQGRYYFDQEAIREPNTEQSLARHGSGPEPEHQDRRKDDPGAVPPGADRHHWGNLNVNGLYTKGRNGRSVWVIPTAQFPGTHYAVFPEELARRCILAATSEYGACAACGAPWRRVVDIQSRYADRKQDGAGGACNLGSSDTYHRGGHAPGSSHELGRKSTTTTGWEPTCKCGPDVEVTSCVVLDPFSGSGTTAFVAASLGRKGIGIDLSAEYIEQARTGRLAQEFLPL